jgi:hypothetical protein
MWNNDFVMYKYMVRLGTFTFTVLSCLEYFDRLSNKWIIEEEEHAWEEALQAPMNDAWEEAQSHDVWEVEVPEPPQQEVLEEVPAPPQDAWYEHAPLAHDAWYAPAPPTPKIWGNATASPDYQPGEGSSSLWGNDGAPSEWA